MKKKRKGGVMRQRDGGTRLLRTSGGVGGEKGPGFNYLSRKTEGAESRYFAKKKRKFRIRFCQISGNKGGDLSGGGENYSRRERRKK